MPNAPTSERLLHAAPARMVWLRPAPDGGAPVVAKVFVQGSRSDAEREHAFADLCRGPGVVDSLGVGDDPATGRPCLLMRHADGVDLAGRVANEGALPAATACALLAPVAATLARLHGVRDARAPHGISHGDVKPRNLLATAATTLLLDFEHAAPIGAAGGHAARGTLGFAAPEALAGAQPAAAADVYGLGATLQWLLAGGDGDVPQAPELAAFVRACTAADPQQRPTAAAAAEQLARFAARLPGEAAEATLTDWATGRFAAPPDAALATDPRAAAWTNRRRLLQRLPRLLDADLATPDQPAAIADALATVVAALQRFPRNGALLARRRALLDAVGRAIAGAGAAAASLRKRDEHAAADAWLGALERAARDAAATPMGLALPDDGDVPEAARRDPFGWLRLLREQAAADAADAADAIARVAACEAQLDVRAAEAAVAAIAAERGGASPLVAQLRDRLHRFGFYVERAARGGPSLARAASLRPVGAFDAPTAFVHAATAGLGAARDDAAAALGLRSLLATLGSIAEEFPHVPTAASARDALHAALAALTDDGWKLVGEARRLLQSVPVPVRPLQLTIGRLDTLRLLEALVDRPERSRSQLLDQIEGLRLQMDQARATRDRLAASAEHALARGHWTTGLFEMERAVARLDADDGGDKEAADKLQERLQAARRKKQDVEAAIKRNADLAARCAALQDDPGSASAARQQALAERRDCLLFLAMNVPEDRGALYRRDLREVDVQHALERASDAEAQLAGAADAEDRARRARGTIEELAEAIAALAADGEPPGRLLRALEHWRAVAAQCQRAIDDERARLVRNRRRRWLAAALVAVAAATAAGLTMWLRG